MRKKPPKLTRKQQGFINDYVNGDTGVSAAMKNYDVKDYDTAKAIASENLTKPYIKAEIDSRFATIQESIQNHSQQALNTIVELLDSADEDKVRLGAAKDILDRAGHKPVEKTVNLSLKKSINFDI